ncbi:hypothetical protein [Helicobacter suis]|nr:hypothetical protein [Helicobacter suis]
MLTYTERLEKDLKFCTKEPKQDQDQAKYHALRKIASNLSTI